MKGHGPIKENDPRRGELHVALVVGEISPILSDLRKRISRTSYTSFLAHAFVKKKNGYKTTKCFCLEAGKNKLSLNKHTKT